jgi:hypothetical protein
MESEHVVRKNKNTMAMVAVGDGVETVRELLDY